MPIDHYFTRSWEFNLRFAGVEPRIVKQTFLESEIAKTRGLDQHDNNILSSICIGIYKFQSYIMRFFYNLKQYIYIVVSKLLG